MIADFVNPKDLPEGKSIVEYLVEETDGGLDYTYDATGVVSLYSPAPAFSFSSFIQHISPSPGTSHLH